MLKKRKFFWLGILLLLLAAAGWGYYQYQRPHQSAAGETANVTIPADSLYAQYAGDEKSCDAKYLGKVVQVSGQLSEVQHSGQSEVWILATGTAGTGGTASGAVGTSVAAPAGMVCASVAGSSFPTIAEYPTTSADERYCCSHSAPRCSLRRP